MKNQGLILLAIAFVCFVSCTNEADPAADKSFFTKFYDNSNFNAAYRPLDAVQTSDGGYLVLATKRAIDTNGTDVSPETIYLLKTDAFGAFVSDRELEENLGMPAPQFLTVGGKHYFFCMDSGLGIQLIEVAEDGTVAQQLTVGGAYPLAAAADANSFILLSYDAGARQTVISSVAIDGSSVSKGFDVGAADPSSYAPEAVIIGHALRTGPQLPFFVGKTPGGTYYFNGIYNYTLSLVFTDLNSNSPTGLIQGNRDDGGVSAFLGIAGGKSAAARFNFGDNYLVPPASLPTTGDATELPGYYYPELVPNAPVKIIGAKINGADRILYGSNTQGKQIVLVGYNALDGTLVGSKYIGFSNSFEIASITPTTDEGLLVLGTTYIAGRFPRICLFKLSSESLGKSFQ